MEEITYVQLFNQAMPSRNTWLYPLGIFQVWENDNIVNSPQTGSVLLVLVQNMLIDNSVTE